MYLRRTISFIALFGVFAALVAAVPAAALVNGTLDPAFGAAGLARVDLSGPSIDVANGFGAGRMVGSANDRFALALPSDPRGTLVLDFDAPAAAYAAAGSDDVVAVGRAGDDVALARVNRHGSPLPGFGVQGRVRTSFGRPAVARGVAIRVDDAFIVGTAGVGADADLVLARYDSHGQLVPTFGDGGTVVADRPGGAAAGYAGLNESRTSPGKRVMAGRAGGAALVARYLEDGTFDPTFGIGGRALLDLTAGDDIAYGLDGWDDGEMLVSGTTGSGGFVARLSKDGVLMPTFGAGGVVMVDLGPGSGFSSVSLSRSSYRQGDQEAIVAAGTLVTPSGRDAVVVRLDHDGTLHAGFGTGGRAVVDFGGAADRATGVKVGGGSPPGDSAVSVLVTGDDGADMWSAALDDAGRPTAPAGGGSATRAVDFSVSSESAEDIVVQPDGAVVTVGSGDPGMVMMRFRPDGRLDPTFGRNGVVVEPGGAATSVALQSDGKILVAGSRGSMQGVFRYLPDGRLDLAFGYFIGFANVEGGVVGAVAQRPDGRIVVGNSNLSVLSPAGLLESQLSIGGNVGVVGLAVEPGGAVVAVNRALNNSVTTGPQSVRLLPDGTRDPNFEGAFNVTPAGIVRLGDGRFFIAGEIVTERTPGGVPSKVDLGLASLTSDGQRDYSVSGGTAGGGRVQLDLGRFDRASGVALTPDGKILVALSVSESNIPRMGLARFLPDGRLDTTFGSKGAWVAALPFISPAVALTTGGRIVVAGTLGYADDNTDVAVAAMAPAPVSSGRPTAWGFGALGQLGVGPAPVIAVAGGTHHTLAVLADGTVRASGWNLTGQLGNGTTVDSNVPVTVAGLTGVVAVAAGTYHSVALKSDGTVWAWGWNYFGQVGDGTTADRRTPVRVTGLTQVTSIAAGAHHNLALRSDGTAFAWGWNGVAQLATNSTVSNSTTDSHVPVPALIQGGVVAVAAGSYHSMFLYGTGVVVTAGWNAFGQLGRGNMNLLAPSAVIDSGSLARKYVAIAGGGLHSLAVRADGTVWAWGYNQLGELGDGTTTDSQTPVMVQGVTNAAFVAGGGYHSLVLGRDGDVRAWGWNGYGQLGTAPGSANLVPTAVTTIPAGTVVRGIAAGTLHSLAY